MPFGRMVVVQHADVAHHLHPGVATGTSAMLWRWWLSGSALSSASALRHSTMSNWHWVRRTGDETTCGPLSTRVSPFAAPWSAGWWVGRGGVRPLIMKADRHWPCKSNGCSHWARCAGVAKRCSSSMLRCRARCSSFTSAARAGGHGFGQRCVVQVGRARAEPCRQRGQNRFPQPFFRAPGPEVFEERRRVVARLHWRHARRRCRAAHAVDEGVEPVAHLPGQGRGLKSMRPL